MALVSTPCLCSANSAPGSRGPRLGRRAWWSVVRTPKPLPEYVPDCYAMFFRDPAGFMIEVVTHAEELVE